MVTNSSRECRRCKPLPISMLISNGWAIADEALRRLWRDKAAFGISQEQTPPRRRADLLQAVPSGNRSRPVREDPWHARADPQLGTGSRGVAAEPKEGPAMHRLRAPLSASSPAVGSPTRRPQAWRDQYRPQGPLA